MEELYIWVGSSAGYCIFLAVMQNLIPGKKYEKYIGAKYKLVDLEKNQRKPCNLKDELEIEFEDGTRILRTVEWIAKNARVINAEIIIEDNKVLFIGVAYHPEVWSRYYLG